MNTKFEKGNNMQLVDYIKNEIKSNNSHWKIIENSTVETKDADIVLAILRGENNAYELILNVIKEITPFVIQPKFHIGQEVWVVEFDKYSGNDYIYKGVIMQTNFGIMSDESIVKTYYVTNHAKEYHNCNRPNFFVRNEQFIVGSLEEAKEQYPGAIIDEANT